MTNSPLADYLFQQPITPKQATLNNLIELELLMSDSAKTLRRIKADRFSKKLCEECLDDIALAKNLLNNWDEVAGAIDLIAKINFKRGLLWERHFVLSLSKDNGSKGGKTTAEKIAEELKERNDTIKARAERLISVGTKSPREVAGILAPIYGLTPRQIRNILNKTEA